MPELWDLKVLHKMNLINAAQEVIGKYTALSADTEVAKSSCLTVQE